MGYLSEKFCQWVCSGVVYLSKTWGTLGPQVSVLLVINGFLKVNCDLAGL
jgi:hypothetical protein